MTLDSTELIITHASGLSPQLESIPSSNSQNYTHTVTYKGPIQIEIKQLHYRQ